MKDALETAHEITKLINIHYIMRRFSTHKKRLPVTTMVLVCMFCVQHNGLCEQTHWHRFCPLYYPADTWIEAMMVTCVTKTKAQINYIQAQMKEFN